jgi:hypothetical protein
MPALQATGGERLHAVSPPEQTRPVRGCSPDERRAGLRPVRRRRLTASGGQPVGLIQPTGAWGASSGAVAPTTGERLFLAWPDLHADTFQLCSDACAPACPDRVNRLRLANRGAHPAPRLRWPAHVQPVGLPPDGPELNPIERVWREVKDDLAWEQFAPLDVPQASVATLWQASDAPTLQALTGDADLVEAINALGS